VQENVKEIADNIIQNSLADPNYKLEAIYSIYSFGFQEESVIQLNSLIQRDFRNADAISFLADIAASNLRYSESISLREKIVKLDPWNAKNYLALVEYHLAIKDFNGAKKFADTIGRFAPDTVEAKKAFEALEQ
jgi:tetratricopeptide (TPR) repeat protein